MGERHAYGTSLFCISRRLFVLCYCCLLTVLCVVKVARWVGSSNVAAFFVTQRWPSQHVHGCTGTECFEVFTCFGLKDTSLHLREPLSSLVGLFMYPIGAYGAHQGCRPYLRLFGAFLTVSALVHLAVLVGDAAYMSVCSAYPANVVWQTLVEELLPPSPLKPAAQAALLGMQQYPFEAVSRITRGFDVARWYFAVAGSLTAFITYAAYQAYRLGDLVERGPLGLGVHYGIAQWDEVLDHDAIRRHKGREIKSQFVDDAKLPLTQPDVEAPLGYMVPARCYGAVGQDTPLEAAMKRKDTPEMQIIKAIRSRAGSYFEEDLDDDDDEEEHDYESGMYMEEPQQAAAPYVDVDKLRHLGNLPGEEAGVQQETLEEPEHSPASRAADPWAAAGTSDALRGWGAGPSRASTAAGEAGA